MDLDLIAKRHELTKCDTDKLRHLCDRTRAERCEGKLAIMVLLGSSLHA